MAPDPKPARRVLDKALMRRLHGQMRECRICGERGASLHHLVPRSQGGDDVEDNLVALDGGGTTGCHGKVESHDRDTRVRLRRVLKQAEIDYIVGKKSRAWLERFYPET